MDLFGRHSDFVGRRFSQTDSELASGWRIIVSLKPGDEEALPRSSLGLSPEGTEPSGFGCPYHFEFLKRPGRCRDFLRARRKTNCVPVHLSFTYSDFADECRLDS